MVVGSEAYRLSQIHHVMIWQRKQKVLFLKMLLEGSLKFLKSATQEKYHEVDLLAPDKIRTLADNQVLFVSSNKHPLIFEFTPYYQNGKYKGMARKGAYQQPQNRHSSTFNQLRL